MGFNLGSFVNSLTGQSSSAKQQASLQSGLNREMAQNYHQWEMEDLRKANLNPALTLGDVSGGGSAGSASTGQGQFNPFDIINSAVSAYNAKKQGETGDTQGALNLAQAQNLIAQNPYIPEKMKSEIAVNMGNATNAYAQAGTAHATTELTGEQTKTEKERRKNIKQQTKRIKQGYAGNIFGTDGKFGKDPRTIAGGVIGLIPGAGLAWKGYKSLKAINSARKFGKGLWK